MAKEPKAKAVKKPTVKMAGDTLTREESVLLGNKCRQEQWTDPDRVADRFTELDLSKAKKQEELDESSKMKNALRNERKKAEAKAAEEKASAEAEELRDRAQRSVNAKMTERESLLASVSDLDAQIKDLKTVASAGK